MDDGLTLGDLTDDELLRVAAEGHNPRAIAAYWARQVPAAVPASEARALLAAFERVAGHDTHPGGEQLKHWWIYGDGRLRWNSWTELFGQLLEHLPEEKAKRIASAWFEERYGYAAGSDINRVKHGKPPRGEKIGPG